MSNPRDWRTLCAEAAEEPDSERVVTLVNQILQAFDEQDQKSASLNRSSGVSAANEI
jgi:hypothetical protein